MDTAITSGLLGGSRGGAALGVDVWLGCVLASWEHWCFPLWSPVVYIGSGLGHLGLLLVDVQALAGVCWFGRGPGRLSDEGAGF